MFDEQKWLAPFDGDAPSGQSLRNENRFSELTRIASPIFLEDKDEDDKIVILKPVDRKTEPIDWDTVLELADELSAVGRDIRLLTIVARAMVGQEGLFGAIGGVDLITSALGQFWDSVHPQLRDGANATRRLNAIMALEDDEAGLYGDLMRLEVMNERGIGTVTLAQLAQAGLNSGQVLSNASAGLGAAEKAALTEQHEGIQTKVKTSCRSMAEHHPERLAALKDHLAGIATSVAALEACVEERLGAPKLRLTKLKTCFDQALKAIAKVDLPEPGVEEEKSQTVTMVTEGRSEKAPIESKAEGGSAIPNQLNSRDDVQQCLQLIIDFYNKTEPSSPIPLLATRMKKMVPMDFMELMQELAPSGLKEFNNVAGNSDKK